MREVLLKKFLHLALQNNILSYNVLFLCQIVLAKLDYTSSFGILPIFIVLSLMKSSCGSHPEVNKMLNMPFDNNFHTERKASWKRTVPVILFCLVHPIEAQ